LLDSAIALLMCIGHLIWSNLEKMSELIITRVLTIKGRNKTLYNKEYPHLSVIVLDVWMVIIGGFRYDE